MKFKSFYERREWQDLRYRVLRNFGFKCQACNRTKADGVVIHVDHVKPISIYPELALTESNLQVLCADCNYGKSNKFEDDHRCKSEESDQAVERSKHDENHSLPSIIKING